MMKSERRILNSVVGTEVGTKLDKKEWKLNCRIMDISIFFFLMMDRQGRNTWLSLLGF